MNNPELINLNTQVVREVAKSVTTPWERIVVRYEIIDTPDTRAQNSMTFTVQKDDAGKHSAVNFVLSDEAKAALVELRDANVDDSGNKWGTCILIIDPPGKFKFDFSYDKPKLLNGILDDEFHFYNKYIPHYLAEKGLTQ